MSVPPKNTFLDAPLGVVYLKTALPIIFLMGMNGLMTVVDALLLGHFVGPEALAAVTLMFPPFMLIVALSTLVANGMSSILARLLGGNRLAEAQTVFASAHILSLLVCAILMLLYWLGGEPAALLAAGGSVHLAGLGLTYLGIMVMFSPLQFIVSINSDALRNEGRIGFMAITGLLISLANIGFDYLLIVNFRMGVAGSAYGTVLAQVLALGVIAVFRFRGQTSLRLGPVFRHKLATAWGEILALGAPQSLGFVGLALGSGVIVACVQWVGVPDYQLTLSAYGIITRIITFTYLPLLGLSFAMQTITGNNYGAGDWRRSDGSIRLAILTALIYCAVVQLAVTVTAPQIGAIFVTDARVIAEVARLLPVMAALYFIAGPLMMISAYFQAIGDAPRSALLSLSKPYLFAIPMTFLLAFVIGEWGIWLAGPTAELMALTLTIVVLYRLSRQRALRWGLFKSGQTRATM